MSTAIETQSYPPAGIEPDPAALAGLDIAAYTAAPLRFLGHYEFDVSPRELWPMVTEAQNIAKWFPIISGGRHDKAASSSSVACDTGSKRMCKTIGMGTLDETFLFSDPPRVSVYTVKNFMMPIKNHVAIMHLEEVEPGKTRMTWAHYADFRGVFLRHVFPSMMTVFMDIGVRKLTTIVGGKGGRTRRF